MFENTSFGRSVELLQRSMDVSTLRHGVIANNIANADVPNFKRSSINFESFLKRAIDTEGTRPKVELQTSDPRHRSNYNPVDWRSIEPRRVLDYLSTEKNNGNNVNAEEEFNEALLNQLRYTMMTQATAYEFNQVSQVLK